MAGSAGRASSSTRAGPGVWAALLLVAALLSPQVMVAQTTNDGLGTHDTSLPIEIVADQLTVEQAAGRAVFLGNVLAEQGDMLLRADRLVVYYALGEGEAAPDQSIRRIEVAGNVTIASTAETAVGDAGFYDVVGAKIELAGNVVLTREANVIRGDLLEIDVERQVAVMSTTSGEAAGGRVRALFQPAPGQGG